MNCRVYYVMEILSPNLLPPAPTLPRTLARSIRSQLLTLGKRLDSPLAPSSTTVKLCHCLGSIKVSIP